MSGHVTAPEVLRQQARRSGVLWYLPAMKKPFAGTTKATSDLIVDLAEQYPAESVTTIFRTINFDPDARGVLLVFIGAGYGDETISDLLNNRVPRAKTTKRKSA